MAHAATNPAGIERLRAAQKRLDDARLAIARQAGAAESARKSRDDALAKLRDLGATGKTPEAVLASAEALGREADTEASTAAAELEAAVAEVGGALGNDGEGTPWEP